MSSNRYDVVGIGNAIVDILSFCSDEFLAERGLVKGNMTLINAEHSAALYSKIGQATECSGGSVANSLAGIASLGGKTAFIGKVADDTLGSIFTHDMRAIGCAFNTPVIKGDLPSANCIVLVTPDSQRTMATYLGACTKVTQDDIDEALIANAKITYIEGYLWDTEEAKTAIRKAMTLAKRAGNKVAMTLSDSFCVHRHRAEFLQLIDGNIDILFANEDEIKALYETDDFEKAIASVRGTCEIVAVTRSEKGSVVITDAAIHHVATNTIAKVVDTTGAGDLFAAGFLFGLTHGYDHAASAKLGNACAGHIIQQLGARSQKPLKDLAA